VTIATEAAEPDPDAVATPPLLMVFDLLYRAGRDHMQRPLPERRRRLEKLIAGSERVFPVRASRRMVLRRGSRC
jgi:ATP-dependent DNA ligase